MNDDIHSCSYYCDRPACIKEQRDELRDRLSSTPARALSEGLTFAEFRRANAARCVKWHPEGIASWSPSDWLTAVTGELGELASLLKMRNRERDGLPGNKFSPTDKMIADEIADVLTYLDLLAEVLGVDLGAAAVSKFNEVSERVGFPDRIELRRLAAGGPSASVGGEVDYAKPPALVVTEDDLRLLRQLEQRIEMDASPSEFLTTDLGRQAYHSQAALKRAIAALAKEAPRG